MKLECSYVQLPKIYKHLSGNELKVFVTMFDQWSMMKNEDGWYYRSQKQLCEDTGLTDRTLRDIIKKFVEKGVIFTTTYNDGVKMATYNKANEYKINMKKVVEMSKEKVVKKVKEGGNFYHPSNNKENKNKIYNINTSTGIHTSNYTPDEENKKYKTKNTNMKKSNTVKSHVDYIIQPDGVNNINSDELSNFNDVVMSGVEVEEDFLKLEENERSDNGTTAMSAISKGEAMLRDATNKMITSTQGNIITSTSGNGEHKVQSGNVISDSSIFSENCPKPYLTPQIPLTPLSFPNAWNEDAIFGSGERQNASVDKLSTNEEKTRQNAQECPQNETDVFKRISEILEEALIITDVEPFKAKLQEALDLLKQIRPSANRNAFTRCCNDTIYWYTQNNWDDWDMFSVASDFKRDIERMKRA